MQNNPHSFKKFKKAPFLFSILFLAMSCFLFYFIYQKINDDKTLAEQMQTDWQNEAARREEIRSLETSVKAIDAERILLESHFAQSSNIVPFLDTVEQLAASVKAKSEVSSVDISKDTSALLVGIKASGSFESVFRFLKLLENSPYELEFASVDVKRTNVQNSSDKTVSAPNWEATFQIKLLSFVP